MKQVGVEEEEEEEDAAGLPPPLKDVTSVPVTSLLVPGPNSTTLGTKPLTHGTLKGNDLRSRI